MSIEIIHDKVNHQFTAVVNDKVAVLKYSISPDRKTLDYYSTFVPPELRGRNIGQEIVKFALDYAEENGYQVIPSCPFVERFINRREKNKN
jgi:predicted GNAT family acetyltransferase